MVTFTAIWDTGATNSAITQAVVDACGLAPTGMTRVQHVDGSSEVETYLVNIGLPNQVGFYGIPVSMATLGDADILIGMDVIGRGDFAVSNFGGETRFSFRFPSIGHIDFVEEAREGRRAQHGGKPKAKRPKRPKSVIIGKKKKRQRK